MSGAFIWYELITPDPDGAKSFYDAVVGWNMGSETVMPGGQDYRMIGRSDGGNAGGVLKLTEEMREHGGIPLWLGYVHVDDVDAAVANMEADRAQVQMAPMDIPGVGRIALVDDPSGAPIYVMKPTPPEGQSDAQSDVFSPDQAQRVRWNELSTSDQDGAIAFYTRHFGWTQEGAMPMGEMGDYKFIQHGGTAIGAIMRRPEGRPKSIWSYYIGVDDIDRATATVKDGGGKVLMGPHEIPGGEFSLNATDPQGATFGLVGPRSN